MASLFGPLTTTWTQPSSCSTAMAVTQSAFTPGEILTVFQGLSCTTTGTANYSSKFDTGCFPPAASSVLPNVDAGFFGYYSPGLICPLGYSTACQTTMGGKGDFTPVFTLSAGETAAGCCPSGFACYNDATTQKCTLTATNTTFAQETCYSTFSGLGAYSVPSYFEFEPTLTTTVSEVIMFAPMFQLNWKSSDLAAVTTNPQTSTITTTVTTATSNGPTNSSSTSTLPPLSNGLSSGAKAGIGIGVAIVALAGIGALAWFILRHRQAKLRGREQQQNLRTPELEGEQKYEMPGQQRASELAHNPEAALSEMYQDPGPGAPERQPYELGSPG